MARTPNRRQREVARQRSRAAAEARQAATRRRQRLIAGAVVGVVVVSIFGAFIGSRSTSTRSPATSTTSLPTATTAARALPDGGVAPVAAPMGDTLTGATPCPADDGSSARTTLFAGEPPTCIDPAFFYVATIRTTKGDLSVQLNPRRAPRTVNDFVVLARYHFYDGQPVTSVQSRASFTLGIAFSGTDADRTPGFDIPSEVPPEGQVFAPGMLAMVPVEGSPAMSRGQLLVATFEDAAGIDQSVTSFGLMLSGDGTIAALDAIATKNGLPAEAVTITSISVVRTSAIPA
jgi:cyclophilin family peptidyl-prolyl cis-trans isomerase